MFQAGRQAGDMNTAVYAPAKQYGLITGPALMIKEAQQYIIALVKL